MITCQLTKLESCLDTIRKKYEKLVPADAALVASALTLTGRHALASYDGEQYVWPDDNEKLMKALSGEIHSMSEALNENAAPKKRMSAAAAAAMPEEEPIAFNVGLVPNLSAGERLLEGREDLKTLLADIVQDGVEFVYSGQDIGWQWALDRANWATIVEGDISRRVKAKAVFTEGAVGVETGTSAPKKRKTSAKAEAETEPDDEAGEAS